MANPDYEAWRHADRHEDYWTLGLVASIIWFLGSLIFLFWVNATAKGDPGNLLVGLSLVLSIFATYHSTKKRWAFQEEAKAALKRLGNHPPSPY